MTSDRRWPTIETAWQATALLLPVALALAVPLSAVDLAYAVRAGQIILDDGAVPRTDPFTFTAAGARWIDQQWLAQVIFALVYGVGGWPGLVVLRAALVGATIFLLFDTLRRSGLDRRSAALLTIAVFVIVGPALALRAQLVAVVLFAATLWLLEVGRRRPSVRWLLVPISVLSVNVHGTFPLVVAAVGVAWLTELAAARADRRPSRRAGPLITSTLLAATLLATLVNPFGPEVWTYAVGLATSPVVAGLASEWQPTSPTTVPGLLFLAAVVAAAALLVRGRTRPPWPTLLWLLALAALALRAERAVVWWAMATGVALAPTIPTLLLPRPSSRRSPANAVLVGALVVACVAALPWWRAGSSADPGPLLADAPSDVTDALAGRIVPGTRAYVTQPWASWVEFALPEVRTFVDSRFEVVPTVAWDDYVRIAGAVPDWEARLGRWGIELVIVDPAREPKLAGVLERSPLWNKVAAGPASGGVVFQRIAGPGLVPDGAWMGQATGAITARRSTNQLMLTAGEARRIARTAS